MTTDDRFADAADRLLTEVQQSLQGHGGAGVACDLAGDVLTMRFAAGGKCTLIRQSPVQQVWLADGVLAWYFDWCPQRDDWVDGRGRGSLTTILQGVLSRHLGHAVPLPSRSA